MQDLEQSMLCICSQQAYYTNIKKDSDHTEFSLKHTRSKETIIMIFTPSWNNSS